MYLKYTLKKEVLNYKPEEDADYEGVQDKVQDKLHYKLHDKPHDKLHDKFPDLSEKSIIKNALRKRAYRIKSFGI